MNAQTCRRQLITIGDRFSAFSEKEASLRVRVRDGVKVGLGLGLDVRKSFIADTPEGDPWDLAAGCRQARAQFLKELSFGCY